MKILFLSFFLLLSYPAFSQYLISDDSITSLVERASSIEEKINILNNASTQLKDRDLKRSFTYASEAYQLSADNNNDIGLINALLNLGRYYTRLGRHDAAMKNYQEAVSLSERISNNELLRRAYNIIGNGYYFKQDVDIALQYYKKALSVTKTSTDDEFAADLQNNIALVFTVQNKLDSAERYLASAAHTYDHLQRRDKLANTLLNWGEVREKMLQFESAEKYYLKALDLNKSLGLKLQEGFALNKLCGIFIELKKYDEADERGKQALSIGLSERFQPLILNTYENLYKLSRARNDYYNALYYHEKLSEVKDSVYNNDRNWQLDELRTKYESEKKEEENQNLLKQTSLQDKQLLFSRLLLGLSVGFTMIVAALAFVYYRAFQENKKAKANLLRLNVEIQQQKEELSEQAIRLSLANEEIGSINENLEKLVQEKTSSILSQREQILKYAFQNAHNVRGPLARILGLINLLSINAIKTEEMPTLISEIEKASRELDAVIREINNTLQDN